MAKPPLTPQQRTRLFHLIETLDKQLECLKATDQMDLPEEAVNSIIGSATMQIFEQLNLTRDEWGFDRLPYYDEQADCFDELKTCLHEMITAAEIIDTQDSPPSSGDVDFLHSTIRESRKALAKANGESVPK